MEMRKCKKSHISICLNDNSLDSAGWTGTSWAGISFLIWEDDRSAPWKLRFYWKVCCWWDILRGCYNSIRFFFFFRLFLFCVLFLNCHFNIYVSDFLVKMIALCIRLCQECQTLIENHDQIKLLSNARNNLNTTLKVGVFGLSYIKLFYHDYYVRVCVILSTICTIWKRSYIVLFSIFPSILSKAVYSENAATLECYMQLISNQVGLE